MPENEASELRRVPLGYCRQVFNYLISPPHIVHSESLAYTEYFGESTRSGFSLHRKDMPTNAPCPVPVRGGAYLANMVHWAMVDLAADTGKLLDIARLPEAIQKASVDLFANLAAYKADNSNQAAKADAISNFNSVMSQLGELKELPLTHGGLVVSNAQTRTVTQAEPLGKVMFGFHVAAKAGLQDIKKIPPEIRQVFRSYFNEGIGVYDIMESTRKTIVSVMRVKGVTRDEAEQVAGLELSDKQTAVLKRVVTTQLRDYQVMALYDSIASAVQDGHRYLDNLITHFVPGGDKVVSLNSAKEVAAIMAAFANPLTRERRPEAKAILDYSNRLMDDSTALQELPQYTKMLQTTPGLEKHHRVFEMLKRVDWNLPDMHGAGRATETNAPSRAHGK